MQISLPGNSISTMDAMAQLEATELVATELVTIESSLPRGFNMGPNPRVLKRKNNYYMLPKSPKSPSPPNTITRGRHRAMKPPSSRGREKGYIRTDGKPHFKRLKPCTDLGMTILSVSTRG